MVAPKSSVDERNFKKAKWVINIPYYENDNNLETHRIHNALSAGCNVVSFKSGDKNTDEFYEDYIYFSDNLVEFFKSHEVKEKKNYEERLGVKFRVLPGNMFRF